VLTIGFDKVAREGQSTRLSCEASEIGIRAGETWPDFISLLNTKGAGLLFVKGPADYSGEDLAGVTYYSQTSSWRLLVIND
jgi:hypothetical protein